MQTQRAKAVLHRERKKRLEQGHPWVFGNEIARMENEAQPGDLVDLVNHQGRYLATGYWNPQSQIAVRVVSCKPVEAMDERFFAERFEQCAQHRRRFVADRDCRLVYGEADFLPGLIVDRFGEVLVVQLLTLGMDRRREAIVNALIHVFSPQGIYERSDVPVRTLEGLEERTGVLYGDCPEIVDILENGLLMEVDIVRGQKTGYFFDQKENRASIAPLMTGWGARSGIRLEERPADEVPSGTAVVPLADKASQTTATPGLDRALSAAEASSLRGGDTSPGAGSALRSSDSIVPSAAREAASNDDGTTDAASKANGSKDTVLVPVNANRKIVTYPYWDGATVLECFAHTGSFTLHACKYGAKKVTCLDVSEHAIETARRNAARNGFEERIEFVVADAFEYLRAQVKGLEERAERTKAAAGGGKADTSKPLGTAGRTWDVVILDPPAFAKTKSAVPGAIRGYKDINLHGLKLVNEGGYLVTASCSYHMRPELFLETIQAAAVDAGKILRLIEWRAAGKDHPQIVGVQESHYLKFGIFEVRSR